MKVNITVDDELMQRIDEYSKEIYMTRSGLVSLACAQFLNTVEATRALKDISLAMRKIAETGTIDEESRKKLDDFETVVKYFTEH